MNRIDRRWLELKHQELKEKFGNDYTGMILVDDYGEIGAGEYVALYVSPNVNILLDKDGWFSYISDYEVEEWEYTKKVYAILKNIKLTDSEEIFNKDNWSLIWEKNKFENILSEREKLMKDIDNEIEMCYNKIDKLKKEYRKVMFSDEYFSKE